MAEWIALGLTLSAIIFSAGGLCWMIRNNNRLLHNHLKHHEERLEPDVAGIKRVTDLLERVLIKEDD